MCHQHICNKYVFRNLIYLEQLPQDLVKLNLPTLEKSEIPFDKIEKVLIIDLCINKFRRRFQFY